MSTPLSGGKSIAQKLHENLAWMRANGASVAEQHAEIAKAQEAINRQNAAEQEKASESPVAQKVAEALVSGLPGASRAVAGYRGALSLAGIGDETPDEALEQQKENVASLPAKARVPLQIAGSIPAAALAAPLGVAAGGAAFGAAQGADLDAESLPERAKNTAVGAGVGAVASKGLQALGQGAAKLASRTGLTDVIEPYVSKVSRKLGSAMGTRGQVNEAMSNRQDLLNATGSSRTTGGKATLDRIANTKARAGELYGIAKADLRGIEDPRLVALLEDPQVAQAMKAVSGIREASGTPLPRTEAPATVPAALSKMGTSQETFDRLMALRAQRGIADTGVDVLAPELKGQQAGGVEIPDPDALAKLKRYLYDAAEGRMESPLNIKQDEARALMPKVDELRQILHETSPAWKEADAFYANAKGQEEAFAKGFDAFRRSNAPTGDALKSNSVEAMEQELSSKRYPGEPYSAQQDRVRAFREGVRAAMGTAVRGAPVDKSLRSAIGSAPFAADQETQSVRGLAFSDDANTKAMEQLIAKLRGEAMQSSGHRPVSENDLAYHGGRIRAAVRSLMDAPDLIRTPRGQQAIQERLASPSTMASEISLWGDGKTTQSELANKAALALAAQMQRRTP